MCKSVLAFPNRSLFEAPTILRFPDSSWSNFGMVIPKKKLNQKRAHQEINVYIKSIEQSNQNLLSSKIFWKYFKYQHMPSISYSYCWLCPCTPCCPLHKYQHMRYLIAIVDCTHVHHVVHYTNISTCHILLLLLTVPMYTMLSTTQISAHAISYCYCWLYPCTPCCPLHKYQHMPYLIAIVTVPMYTMLSTTQISAHAISYCYCWLCPCIPCCPLHKYQHMPYLIAIVDCTHVHHVVHYTNISTCHILLLLLTVPMYTMLSTTQISAHAISYCYCWLYPCTPCCPLHKYQHMPYLIAIVDCTHVHHVVHYTYQHMPYLIAIVDSTHVNHVVHYTYQYMPCLVAIVDCTHVGSATASFKDLVTLHRRTPPTKQQTPWLWISIQLGNSFPGERTPQIKQQNRVQALRSSHNIARCELTGLHHWWRPLPMAFFLPLRNKMCITETFGDLQY